VVDLSRSVLQTTNLVPRDKRSLLAAAEVASVEFIEEKKRPREGLNFQPLDY
jgi:hypothetical protein